MRRDRPNQLDLGANEVTALTAMNFTTGDDADARGAFCNVRLDVPTNAAQHS